MPVLKLYQCHKQVRAAKIERVDPRALVLEGSSRYPIEREFLDRCKPQPGGYLVVYEDGYESYSPAKPFEEGYKLILENGTNT